MGIGTYPIRPLFRHAIVPFGFPRQVRRCFNHFDTNGLSIDNMS
jgi:hypothetical protein